MQQKLPLVEEKDGVNVVRRAIVSALSIFEVAIKISDV